MLFFLERTVSVHLTCFLNVSLSLTEFDEQKITRRFQRDQLDLNWTSDEGDMIKDYPFMMRGCIQFDSYYDNDDAWTFEFQPSLCHGFNRSYEPTPLHDYD